MAQYIYNIGVRFSVTAQQNANRTALKYHDGLRISYTHLDTLSNRIAHYLLSRGLQKGDVIALFNNKSPLGYATMLAALKCGIIYTNLDHTSPFQRIKKITERCMPKLLVYDVEYSLRSDMDELNIPSINIFEAGFEAKLDTYSTHLPIVTPAVTGQDAAYIMFTSGSTGFPKGAVISHANLINFINWGQAEYGITQDDILTNANPIYFDNSVFDFYISLFSGAQLAPFTNDVTRDPFLLVKAVAAAGCTTWFSVPSLLVYLITTKALAANSLPDMKRFIFGGEGFPKPRLKKLYEMYGATAGIYNVYGPTECTCICSSYKISETDFEDMNNLAPLGFLAPNFSYVLINTDDTGTFGELCLKGPNVGAGYYNDADRTLKSFIQNPYNNYYNEIIYTTGDLVQVDAKGHLHFKGRADNQVKHMGYRIELEEIEAMLNTLPYVNESAVIYERINESLGQIIAFVATDVISDAAIVTNDIKKLVPDYMIPRKVLLMPVLPKNQNGKTDKTVLKDYKNTI